MTMHSSTSSTACESSSIPSAGRSECLAVSSSVNRSTTPARRAAAISSRRATAVSVDAAVGEHGGGLHASTPSSAATTSVSAPARPSSANHTNVSRLPAGPGRPDGAKPCTERRAGGDGRDRLAAELHVAHHAALADTLPPHLELRLDHRQAVVPRRGHAEHGRQHLPQGDERDVDHDQVGRVRELVGLDRARVATLDHGHALVVAQPPVELAVGDVERDHVRGAALQQAVGEAARRGADVERLAPRDVDRQRVERVGELDAAARDELGRSVDAELDVVLHKLPRLGRSGAPGTEVHLACEHRRGGPRTRGEQPTVRQQAVEADPGHGAKR